METMLFLLGLLAALSTTSDGGSLMSTAGTSPGPDCDDCFSVHTLEDPFIFYCKPYSKIYVNENGVVSFGRDFWHFIPKVLPLTADSDQTMPIFAAYWTDHNIQAGGNIWVRNHTNQAELDLYGSYVRLIFNGCHNGFNPTRALIVTYENVAPYCSDDQPGLKNTYQVILMTNGVDSYVMLNYADLQWSSGCGEEHAVAGFNAGDGSKYLHIIDSVGTVDVKKLATTTNLGLKGRHMFRVSGNVAVKTGCLINDACPVRPVDGLPCKCFSSPPMPLTTYDGATLAITLPQKTLLTVWGNNTRHKCKFDVVAVSSNQSDALTVPLYVNWVAISVGVFPKQNRPDKYLRNYMISQGAVYARGWQTKDEEIPVSVPHYWASEDENTDMIITKSGNTVQVRSTRCEYGLDVVQNGRVTKVYKIYTGALYKDGQMDGMCGNCDGNSANDNRLCGGAGSSSDNTAITRSCEKGDLMLIGK